MTRTNGFNKKAAAALFFIFFVGLVSEAAACWGNRPLAMGGAFTGLADDTNAIYWNPGGLGLNSGASSTQMSNLGGKNSSNYDQYLAFATEIVDQKKPEKNYGTFAFAYVSNDTVIDKDNNEKEYNWRDQKRKKLAFTEGDKSFIDRDTYVQIGYGVKPFRKQEFSVGVNLKSVKSEVDDPVDDRDTTWMDLDLGAIWRFGPHLGKSRMFSIGFLLQNVGEAKLIETNDAKTPEMVQNFRPGFSIKPDEHTSFSLELYDAAGATAGGKDDLSQNIRVGMERWVLADFCALRAGIYHVNNTQMRAYTGGIGINLPEFWNFRAEIDLTIMHWDNTGNNTGFGGLTVLF